MRVNLKSKKATIFIKNFIGGIGWMMGATIGFALFITLLSLVLKWLGGLPIVGDFFASLIEVTNKALETRKAIQ